jgi:hypothetical protein
MAHIEQITEIEEIVGLHDETHSDEEVDATLVQAMEIEKGVDEDCNEDGDEDCREDGDVDSDTTMKSQSDDEDN